MHELRPPVLANNGHRREVLDGRVQSPLPVPWSQWEGESIKAFSAFTLYLNQGPERSLRAVAEECTKHESLVRRWSARWNWRQRALAHDRDQARQIHERLSLQLARIRERDLKLADLVDEKTRLRLEMMKLEEVYALSATEIASLIRVSSDLKYKPRDVSPEKIVSGFPSDLPAPVFVIQLIPERPDGYVYVRFGDDPIRDGWTWIKEEDVVEYRKAHPDHFVIA
jgi:hypothetical protein